MTAPPAAPRRRGRPLDPDAHRRILAATVALLAERGPAGLSVAEVAAAAGVGKATVYRHYEDKDALVLRAVETVLLAEVPAPDTGSLAGDLTAVYRAEIALAASPQGSALIRFLVQAATADDRYRELFRRSLDASRAAADVMVDRAVARGELPSDVDREWLWEAMPARLMLRQVIGAPLPDPADVPTLVAWTVRAFGGRASLSE